MTSSLDSIVNITITQQTQAVPTAGFGVPLIVGPTGFLNSDVLRYYTSPAAMLTDGFTTSSIEYIYAVEAFEQALSPSQIGVGKRLPAVAQVDYFGVGTLTSGHVYAFTLNGTVISYTALLADTEELVLGGLLTAIGVAFPTNPPVTGLVVGTGPSASLHLTSTQAGLGVSYTAINSLLTHVLNLASYGIVNDLTAILNAPNGNLWYGLALCSNTTGDILQAASFIETLKKIYIAASGDSTIPTTSITDVASVLQGKAYTRTALAYSPQAYNLGMDAAWLGGQLPQTPGASTWKFKQLVGISPDSFTSNQRTILIGTPGVTTGKGVNIYEAVGGVNITEEGWMVGGQFIDITVFIDWLESTMQTNIFSLLIQSPKIPYTDQGVTVVENAVRQTLKQGSDDGGNGGIDHTSIIVNTEAVASIPANTRAQRILPSGAVTFSCRLTGAFHFVYINGIVTV